MNEEEIHPWKWFGPDNSKTLIVGTFPTAKKNWHYDFFYPNIANLFWTVMSRVSGEDLKFFSGEEAVAERQNIVRKLKVTVTDMGYKIVRYDKSSLDEKLVPLEFMNILQILDENPTINKIIFTSSSGKVNAAKWFNNFLKQQNINHKFPNDKKPIRSVLHYKDKQIQLVILYSTSPRAAYRISINKLVEMYRNELMDRSEV